jgi:hypothetical protein
MILPQGLVKNQHPMLNPQTFISQGFGSLKAPDGPHAAQPARPRGGALWYDAPGWDVFEFAASGAQPNVTSLAELRTAPPLE